MVVRRIRRAKHSPLLNRFARPDGTTAKFRCNVLVSGTEDIGAVTPDDGNRRRVISLTDLPFHGPNPELVFAFELAN